MSSASFDRHTFLMKISPNLLTQYAERQEIPFTTIIKESGEELAEDFLACLSKLLEEKRNAFWLDSADIDEMSTSNGCDYLIRRIIEGGIEHDEKQYKRLKNGTERALYFYLNFYELFTETSEEYNIDRMQGWRGEKTVSKKLEDIIVNIADLEQGLREIYKKEYKGDNLKIKHTPRKGRVIFAAFVEDSLTNDTAFKHGTLSNRVPRKPVFPVYYLYRPEEGILEVKAQGGKGKIELLKEAFIVHLLKAVPQVSNEIRYNFESIQNIKQLQFPVVKSDLVDTVTLKGLRLTHNTSKTYVSIDVSNTSSTGTEPMIATLKRMRIDLMDYRVTQFKLEIVFDKVDKGRTPKVTVTIGYPNVCNLREREIDNEVRRLLKKWNLDLY